MPEGCVKAVLEAEPDGRQGMEMIDLQTIQSLNRPETIAITEHARIRLAERNISVSDVIRCIASGEIIKQYEDDKPLPSCLILGKSDGEKYIHVVISHDEEYIYLITAYCPNSEQWEPDYKTRRGR